MHVHVGFAGRRSLRLLVHHLLRVRRLLEVLDLTARNDSARMWREMAMLPVIGVCLRGVIEERCWCHGLRIVHDGVLVSELFLIGMSERRAPINKQCYTSGLALSFSLHV